MMNPEQRNDFFRACPSEVLQKLVQWRLPPLEVGHHLAELLVAPKLEEDDLDLLRYFLSTYPNVLYALCPEPRDAFRELLERRNMVEEYVAAARKWAKREVPEVGIQREVNETVRETQRAKEEADRLLDDLVDLFEKKKKGRRKR